MNQKVLSNYSKALILILLIAGVAVVSSFVNCTESNNSPSHRGLPINSSSGLHVILFIGDGMHYEHEMAASRYLYGADQMLVWNSFPLQAYVSTWDINVYNQYAASKGKPPYDPLTFLPNVGYDVMLGGIAPYPLDPIVSDAYFLGGISAT